MTTTNSGGSPGRVQPSAGPVAVLRGAVLGLVGGSACSFAGISVVGGGVMLDVTKSPPNPPDGRTFVVAASLTTVALLFGAFTRTLLFFERRRAEDHRHEERGREHDLEAVKVWKDGLLAEALVRKMSESAADLNEALRDVRLPADTPPVPPSAPATRIDYRGGGHRRGSSRRGGGNGRRQSAGSTPASATTATEGSADRRQKDEAGRA